MGMGLLGEHGVSPRRMYGGPARGQGAFIWQIGTATLEEMPNAGRVSQVVLLGNLVVKS